MQIRITRSVNVRHTCVGSVTGYQVIRGIRKNRIATLHYWVKSISECIRITGFMFLMGSSPISRITFYTDILI